MSLASAIETASSREEVPGDVLEGAFGAIMDGEASEAQIAALLIALRTKGETVSELVAAARALRARADRAELIDPASIDTCGTGGDGADTFNISTVSAFVVAGAGVTVAKHGNRAASSQCGSFDVLEALGVHADLPIATAAEIAREVGIGFFFARRAHPAMRHVAGVRQQLRVRTIMNCLGPLLNPVGVRRQLVGVYQRDLVRAVASALSQLGSERALVVHGEDGLDELTTVGATHALLWDGVELTEHTITPEQVGLERTEADRLRGGDAGRNAEIARAVLAGEPGPPRDIVLLNAAAGLWVAGTVPDLGSGVERARESIDSGAARGRLEALIERSAAADS